MDEPGRLLAEGAELPEHLILVRCAGFGTRWFHASVLRRDGDRRARSFLDICRWLRDDPDLRFEMLMTSPPSTIPRTPRFEIVYHLYSLSKNHRFRLKVPLVENDPKLPSVVSLWSGANWLERETYDLYGIVFDGHPDLRRIYLYEEFEGHPLRKDYPKEKRQPLIGPGSPGVPSDGGSGAGS
jgi:NADH-quinone oxidoreductase subunit C